MAIATLAEYKTELVAQRQIVSANIGTITTIAGRPYDSWTKSLPAGVAPTTSVVPTNSTVGALGQSNPANGTQLNILGAQFSALVPGTYLVCDRLSHQGGLSGIVTTAQTTNLPTAALTRNTTGDGVMLGITIYTAVGATATTIRASYTNQSGTAGRLTPLITFGGTAFRELDRLVILPLQSGDTGVRSVQSVTVIATTGTAGNFGVTLFKPLYGICVDDLRGSVGASGFITGKTIGGIAKVEDNACLFIVPISQSINGTGCGTIIVGEN
jgi:hypothetical protein